jgi:hypothetical protein
MKYILLIIAGWGSGFYHNLYIHDWVGALSSLVTMAACMMVGALGIIDYENDRL